VLTVDLARLGVQPGERLLDLGCGGGRHAFAALRAGAHVVALDADPEVLPGVAGMIEALRADELGPGMHGPGMHGGAIAGDALRLPFPDGTFDRVIASEVLEHVPADGQAIAELVRVTRPGGRLAVTVPAWLPERVCWALDRDYHDTPGGHVRIYRRRGLEQQLVGAGLILRDGHRAHALHSPYWWLQCAVGLHREDTRPVRAYRRVLEHQIVAGSRALDTLDRVLDPVLGKSLVLYADRRP